MFKPMVIILIGAIITIVGGVLTAVGTYRQNKSSSSKSDAIFVNTGLTVDGVKKLQAENVDLKNEVKSLSGKQDELLASQDTLQQMLEPFIEYSYKLYPTLDKEDALKKLSSRLNDLSSELAHVKNTITSFDATVYIKFSGTWDENPYPQWRQPPKPETYLRWIDTTGKTPDLEFKSPKVNYVTLNKTTGAFDNVLAIQPGAKPLGEQKTYLSKYNRLLFWFTFSFARNLKDTKIEINEIRIIFSINGVKEYQIISNEIHHIDLKGSISLDGDYASPSIQLDGFIVDLIKIPPPQ
jgi:hypothetical protein